MKERKTTDNITGFVDLLQMRSPSAQANERTTISQMQATAATQEVKDIQQTNEQPLTNNNVNNHTASPEHQQQQHNPFTR